MNDKDIVKKLKEIITEQELRLKLDKVKTYNVGKKVHKKQLEFHKNNSKNRWVFGGNRSGKTECGAVEAIYMARGNHPYKENRKDVFGWVVSLSQQVQRDVAQSKILHYLSRYYIEDIIMSSGKKGSPEGGIIDQIKIKNVFGGISTIGFKSCDQGREKFQGSSLDFVWFDEEPPKDIYEECKMRVLDKCGYLFGTMTPLKGLSFVYDDIYLKAGIDKDIWCIFMEWGDNPFLNKNQVKELTESLSDDQLESRRYGRFKSNQGLVYTEFDENIHVIEPFTIPFDWQDTLSIDPGLNNPLSCHWYAVDYDDNIYVVAEHYEAKQDIDYHANKIKQISSKLGWHKDSKGRINALIDSAANQKTLASLRSVTELFYDHDILANPNVNKDLFSGIARVKGYFKNKKIFIFKTCVNLIREIKGYWWGEGDTPKKRDDHSLDELRYYIMTKPQGEKPKEQLTAIQKDKQSLIRKIKKS